MGYEIYFSAGPLLIGSEYYVHRFSSSVIGDANFRGGEAVVCYLITGESRPYNTTGGNIYGFVPVDKPVFQGGPGTWEAVLRFSTLNLDDGAVQGGTFWRFTPMVNWSVSRRMCGWSWFMATECWTALPCKAQRIFSQSRIQLAL